MRLLRTPPRDTLFIWVCVHLITVLNLNGKLENMHCKRPANPSLLSGVRRDGGLYTPMWKNKEGRAYNVNYAG